MNGAELKVKLNTGAYIPMVGTGSNPTSRENGYEAQTKEWLLTALKNGYRHIDTAFSYGALEYVEGVLMPKNADGTFRTTESVNFNQSWAEMEKLLETGKVKAIGVSNFSIKTLEELFKTAKITPAVNQVEMHPYLARNELRNYCRSVVREDPLIVSLAKKYGVTPTQIILAWHISRGNVFVAKSENDERQKENITIPVISEEDLGKIWHLDRGMGVCPVPTSKPGEALGWTYERLGWEHFHPKV
ncbi:unnamed protein product [Cyclocybe aegerita]|uniref:NADP-dependent oxidoreductase domain-containing protein n=1 Tax=Cyclocybe aegerita TaxID=1973307 RepID=A0A8S0W7W8_CYCAE|nr:unnamed protein product [Cyclocybe aegerita]